MNLNMRIFQGKKKVYNQLIFECLSQRTLKEWDLAKNIYDRMKKQDIVPDRWKDNDWYHVTSKIYSVLVRRKYGGRLKELESCQYIEKVDERWELTSLKGMFASWLANPDLSLNTYYWKKQVMVKGSLQILPFLTLSQLEKEQTDWIYGSFHRLLNSPSLVKLLFFFMRNRLSRGELDLDQIYNEHFNELVFKEAFATTYTSVLPIPDEVKTDVSEELKRLIKTDIKYEYLIARSIYEVMKEYRQVAEKIIDHLEPFMSRYTCTIKDTD